MKVLKATRHLDELGRIVLPIEMRKEMGITENDELEVKYKFKEISIIKPKKICLLCNETKNLQDFKEGILCNNCINEIKEIKI